MNQPFNKDKVVVITGGAKKIGRATAKKLADQGFNILIHTGGKSIDEAKKTVAIVKEYGVQSDFIDGDLADIKTIDKIKSAAEKLGTPSVLINNAGLRIHDDFEKITYEDWKRVMTVNVDASFLCTQALIGHMTKQKWGRVINIGGLSAHIGAKERAHVVTSKAALIGLTKAISMEFLERGVTCNCVVPGFIEDFDSKEKALKGHWLRHPQTPNLVLNRFGNPDEVAEVIANLCKKEADYINGQTLHVNGGSYTP
ncbi:SDR family NAD(P)-dependent oxidoreductase [Candidatus Pelagibacter sp. HIMB1517]|uniref:SDR family NAD(P)-dependent oxidoreductase n=1 Tax=Candidatus Pelagibacter sp. HIMB1517 TaxID=3413341 RepID=UPI003F83E8C1